MTTAGSIVLRTVGLTKRYGARAAVDNVDIQVQRGRVYGFLGPNGAGKTTTIGIALGLLSATSGHVEMFGEDTRGNLPRALKRVGATIEGQSYFPHLSARDNLRVWARTSDIGAKRIDEVLEQVGLAGRAKEKVRTYSLGMRQRLAVGVAILHDPELILLDEPTNGLDPAGIREFRGLVRTLAAEGKTIFISSHILSEVEQMCDDVGIIKSGRVVTQTAVSDMPRNASSIELRTTDNLRATEMLRALPWVAGITSDAERLVIEAPVARSAEISQLLAGQGVYVAELRPRESSLEDFFLEVTGDGGPDA